jgi:adenylate cyclase
MRRLAAIMFTDMVGYSALTQKDEALALELLGEHRQILRPYFGKHEGREIETAGDAFFVEFNSAVEAAMCAIEIQEALHARNETESRQRQILIRIGLHIGDVVYVDQHVHGDGVNIAARMEPLASPGGICISEDVARQIKNKIPYPVRKLGAEKLKNISMPMEIYCIQLPWPEAGKKAPLTFPWKKAAPYGMAFLAAFMLVSLIFYFKDSKGKKVDYAKYRLAVLPLANISNEPKDAYFADGMTEELISSLSKITTLNVIARTSVMKYKDTEEDISEIGEALMVGTILEGSVRRFGNKVRVTVQLIDVHTQEHRWTMEYDRDLQDIFLIQSEIARNVAEELKIHLASSENEQLDKIATDNLEAYHDYQIGKHYLNKKTAESIQMAISLFERAISLDPAYALPYATLAYAYTLMGVAGYGHMPREVATAKAKAAVLKALELDPNLAEAHAALGYIEFRVDWDWPGAEKEFRRAIALNPSYATAHEWYALFLAIHGKLDPALVEMRKASSLDPLSPVINTGLARIYQFRNEFDKALAQVNKTLGKDSLYADAYFTKAMIYSRMQQYEASIAPYRKAIALSNRRPIILGALGLSYGQLGRTAEAGELLAELQAPPQNNDKLYAISMIKSSLGQHEEAFDILEKLLEDKYGVMIYMKVEEELILESDSPRYKRMLKKMGLE